LFKVTNLRYKSGIDGVMDRNEYAADYNQQHPYDSPYSNYRHANEEFNLADRNRDGRVDYYEYSDAQYRKHGGGYYPGAYSSRYGSYSYY
jgi:hypothetical protein